MRDIPIHYHVRYACWGLLPAHVKRLRPDWDDERATAFLLAHQEQIAAEMARLGWSVLAAVLDETDEGNP